LTQVLSFHQVMPAYLNFVFPFGVQIDPKETRFSGFRERTQMISDPLNSLPPQLGRSGQFYELCYNLRGVSLVNDDSDNDWSIRQAAIYHRFDIASGNVVWIVTKGGLDLQQRFKHLTGDMGRPEDKSFGNIGECFRSSLAAHLLYCQWATEDWRWYVLWMENLMDAEVSIGRVRRDTISISIEDVQDCYDRTIEAIMSLQANVMVISSIKRFYAELKDQNGFPSSLTADFDRNVPDFTRRLDSISWEFERQIDRAKVLASIIGDRKDLLLRGEEVERTETLNKNLEKDAIMMRIITAVTLLYLPATFVSVCNIRDAEKIILPVL
ncbi:hypothetical protein EJ04DRAFT_603831, partial [Polyplosphaeria fusca]